jgi:hypothetical protein
VPSFYVEFAMGEDGIVERALNAALKGAIEIGKPEHFPVVVPTGIDMTH